MSSALRPRARVSPQRRWPRQGGAGSFEIIRPGTSAEPSDLVTLITAPDLAQDLALMRH
jgi:hypothetical protein